MITPKMDSTIRISLQDVAFDALFEGQSVDYEMESGPKGDRASVVIPA